MYRCNAKQKLLLQIGASDQPKEGNKITEIKARRSRQSRLAPVSGQVA